MKLNMGCGNHSKEGYENVDKYPPADTLQDLEKEWIWPTDSVDEVVFHHSLEHMGATAEGFFTIMKELYRVCKNDAKVIITVPHPRHDDFMNDPTHVRVITPMILELFSKENNKMWAEKGHPNTPLGLQLDVDFKIVSCNAQIENEYNGQPEVAIRAAVIKFNNVIKFYTITLKVVK
jgi:hypothetical protein